MVNEEHYSRLKKDVEAWNEWRQKQDIKPDLSGAYLSGAYLSGLDLSGADLSGADLSGADLSRSNLSRVNFSGANLNGANLSGAYLSRANLSGAYLSRANLSRANLNGLDLSGADLNGADLSGADLSRLDLSGADLWETNLSGADLSGANLIGAKLIRVSLSGANLIGANLRKANLTGATLRKANLSGANLSGANLSGANLTGANLTGADFSAADLSMADFRQARPKNSLRDGGTLTNFSKADFSGADFSGANLSDANLSRANLSGANLSGANFGDSKFIKPKLSGANLRGANLRGFDFNRIDLSGADLRGVDLRGTNLCGLDFNGFDLSGANLCDADLSRTQALGTDFTGAEFTGTCIEDWNINSATKLDNIDCQYVYLRSNFQERRPSSGEFAPGDFTKLFQKALETVDLIFADGIDWKAFLLSFQELQAEYGEENLSVQAIEKKSGGAFVIRLEVSPEANKADIEFRGKELYQRHISLLEGQLKDKENLLNDYKKIVDDTRQDNTDLKELIKTLADNRPTININMKAKAKSNSMSQSYQPKYDQKNSNIQFVDTAQSCSNLTFNQQNFSQNINQSIDDITRLINSLREKAQEFPQDKREEILVHLDDLQEDISKPEKQKPERIKTRIIALITIAGTVFGVVANSADFTNNVLEIADKLGIPIPTEISQPQRATQQLPPTSH